MDQRKGDRLWLGVFLIGLGILFLLAQLDVFRTTAIGELWPLLILGLGVIRAAFGRGRHRWGGFWLIVTGIYCSIGVWSLFGLSWHNAWPIFVIAAGVSILGRGRADHFAKRKDGSHDL